MKEEGVREGETENLRVGEEVVYKFDRLCGMTGVAEEAQIEWQQQGIFGLQRE